MQPLNTENFAKTFQELASELNEDELRDLLNVMIVQDLEASEALIAENTISDVLFMVWDGYLDVWMSAAKGDYKVARVGPGSFLGEISLLDPGLATATVRTEQGCTALHLGRAELDKLWELNPHLVTVFLNILSRTVAARIRSADRYLNKIIAGEILPVARPADAAVGVHTKLYDSGEN